MSDSQPFAGKVAIVTGAGRLRGIGRATALALAESGANVVVTGTGRSPERYTDDEKSVGWRDIESVADEIRELGQHALPLVIDVTDALAVDEMVDRVVSELGRVDILVNNAAAPMGPDRAPLVEVDEAVFKRVLEIKVLGAFHCSKSVAKRLLSQGEGGRIVMVSSVEGKRGRPLNAAYNASNFAMNGLTQSFARELGPAGITVNAVCPGLIPTARWDGAGGEAAWGPRLSEVPLGRAGTDEEVAGLIRFLCSPAASYINGQAINIDGGMVTEH